MMLLLAWRPRRGPKTVCRQQGNDRGAWYRRTPGRRDDAAGGDMSGAFFFAISADYARRTGGWVYAEHLLDHLALRGWRIDCLTLPAGFPDPDARARAAAARAFAALPDDSLVLVDHLCLGVLPDVAEAQGRRLRLVVLVHHPLALEGLLAPAIAARLQYGERAALAHAAGVVATSAATARMLAEDYGVEPGALVVAEPGVDALPLATGSGEVAPRLLAVGAVVPRKGHDLLVAALAGLADRPWRLLVAGNLDRAPAHVARLRALVDTSGLAARVTFAGELEAAAMEVAWNGADLFVTASHHEGYGMAVAEALRRGLPVVATDAAAVGEWLDRRAGVVVPSGDAASLRTALATLLDDPARRAALADGARAASAALPGWEMTAAIVDRALRQLAPTRRCRQIA